MFRAPKHAAVALACLWGIAVAAYGQAPSDAQREPANQLNPAGTNFNLWPWTSFGMNPIVPDGSHSPWGLRYGEPSEQAEPAVLESTGLEFTALLNLGILGVSGDNGAASFSEYGDMSPGLLAGGKFSLTDPSSSRYLTVSAGSAGRNDQYARLAVGRYARYNVTATYRSTPHLLSSAARSLWDGAGSRTLTLPSSVIPGDRNSVRDVIRNRRNSVLEIDRDKMMLSFDVKAGTHTRIYAKASTERREGARQLGTTFGYPFFGQVTEIIAPIDYQTHDFSAGFAYAGPSFQINALYTGSLFNNTNLALRWENPGITPFPQFFVPQEGEVALAPDNSYHNVKLDLAGPLPLLNGRFSSSLSWSRMRQDDSLIAPTASTGQIQSGGSIIDLDDWRTPAILSRRNSDAEREFLLAQAKLIFRPARKFRLAANLRIRDESNGTRYTALNSRTGQFGYPTLDGGIAAIIPTSSAIFDPDLPGSRVRYRSIPFAKDVALAAITANWHFAPKAKLSLGLDRRRTDYDFRERQRVTDDRIEATLLLRGSGWGNVQVSYELANRTGSEYRSNPYEPFYTSSLEGYTPFFPDGDLPHTLSALRKFDLASRRQNTAELRSIIVVGPKTDFVMSARHRRRDFSADFGLRDSRESAFNAEWSYRFSRSNALTMFLTIQQRKRNAANIGDAFNVGTDPQPGGVVFPFENVWTASVDERNNFAGINYNYANRRVSFDARYSFLNSKTATDYSFATEGAFLGLYSAAQAGSGFPEQVFKNQILEADLRFRLRDNLSLSFFARWEREDIDDFHYTGLSDPVVADAVLLGVVPEGYSSWVFGVHSKLSF